MNYQFEVCDICLSPNQMIIMDCSCGRSICQVCLEKNSGRRIQERNLEFLNFSCIQCLKNTKFCWYCRGDSSDELITCELCPFSFHKSCKKTFNGNDKCSLHQCDYCQQDIVKSPIKICYLCLNSYHAGCSNVQVIDDVSEVIPCVCNSCIKLVKNIDSLHRYLKRTRKDIPSVTSFSFIVNQQKNLLYTQKLINWLNQNQTGLLKCYQTAILEEEDYHVFAIVILKQFSEYHQNLLAEMLQDSLQYQGFNIFGLSLNLLEKTAATFDLFVKLSTNAKLTKITNNFFPQDKLVQYQQQYNQIKIVKEPQVKNIKKPSEKQNQVSIIKPQEQVVAKQPILQIKLFSQQFSDRFVIDFFETNSKQLFKQKQLQLQNHPIFQIFLSSPSLQNLVEKFTFVLKSIIIPQNDLIIAIIQIVEDVLMFNITKLFNISHFCSKLKLEIIMNELQNKPCIQPNIELPHKQTSELYDMLSDKVMKQQVEQIAKQIQPPLKEKQFCQIKKELVKPVFNNLEQQTKSNNEKQTQHMQSIRSYSQKVSTLQVGQFMDCLVIKQSNLQVNNSVTMNFRSEEYKTITQKLNCYHPVTNSFQTIQ